WTNAGGVLDDIDAPLFADGGSGPGTATGDDRLHLDDTGDPTDNTGDLTLDRVTGLGMTAAADPDRAGITYTGLEVLEIHLGSGADLFTIHSTHLGSTLLKGGP